MKKRVTPEDEFERFAERLYNYNPDIQTKLDFDKTYEDYMAGVIRSKTFKEKTWGIMRSRFGVSDDKSARIPTNKKRIKQVKKIYKEDHLARVWDKQKKHYRVMFVRAVKGKDNVVRYMKGNRYVTVDKVKKVE